MFFMNSLLDYTYLAANLIHCTLNVQHKVLLINLALNFFNTGQSPFPSAS